MSRFYAVGPEHDIYIDADNISYAVKLAKGSVRGVRVYMNNGDNIDITDDEWKAIAGEITIASDDQDASENDDYQDFSDINMSDSIDCLKGLLGDIDTENLKAHGVLTIGTFLIVPDEMIKTCARNDRSFDHAQSLRSRIAIVYALRDDSQTR